MPSIDHELPLELVRNRPLLAPELLRTAFGVATPDDDRATLGSESFADVHPAELRCDATVLIGDPEEPSFGIIVETQLRYSKRKTFSWPAYLSSLRLRHECPVVLLVLCPDESTARRCDKPIEMGHPGWTLKPLVLCPGRLPAVTDPEEARRQPEMVILSALGHAEGPESASVLKCAAAAIDSVDPKTGRLYHDYLTSRLSAAPRELLEKIVKIDNYEWQSDFAKSHRAEGRAEGEAEMLLNVLEARGFEIRDDVRERITSCTDTALLTAWGKRAVAIEHIEELFA
ncbi:hypothetical protein BTM25_12720 [Actinomadura rubteroloni]|uniref:Uncharacterized protein n=1 Tax=Actinomadura rubteroloni TaxID=1926885 RepID=A0A2P4UP94_9ACTN|nr:hypothetical protein [Actinomadura rubteroloni]POM26864.1 hypothetical protein BTM25_12720 [Actinomadura rubteroloni]